MSLQNFVAIYPIVTELYHSWPEVVDSPTDPPENWHCHPYSHAASLASQDIHIVSYQYKSQDLNVSDYLPVQLGS